MGLGGINIWQLLIILVIVLLLFGTKKLRGIGTDLGGAVKGFKDSMAKEDSQEAGESSTDDASQESAALNEDAQASEEAAKKEKETNS